VKTLYTLLALLLIASFVVACQPNEPAPPAGEETEAADDPPAEDEVVTIKWLNHWGDPETLAFWENVVAEFEAENPDINVEIINSSFDDLLTTYMTQFGVGNAPDVFHAKYDLIPDLVESDAILAPPAEAQAEIAEKWSTAGVEGMTWKDEIYGYPTEIGLRGMMYNEDLLMAAGVEMPPTEGYTFQEYAEMAKTVTENTDAKGAGFIIQYEASLFENFTNFLWNNGGQFINEEKTEVLFNSPEGVEVLTLWKQMVDEGSVALYNTDDMASALATESVATYVDANWWKLMFFSTYDETHGEGAAQETFKVAGVPYDDANTSRAFVFGQVVSSQTEHPEAAWKFVRFTTMPRSEDGISYMGEFLTTFWGIIPSNLQDQQNATVLQEEPYTRAYVDILNNYGQIQPVFEGYIEIQRIVSSEIEKVFQTGKDPQAALDDAAAAANDVLSNVGD
jgi:multiple sugar transport system substrate-binding protein